MDYVKPLTEFYSSKELTSICNVKMSLKKLRNQSWNALALRILITMLFRRFCQHCLQYTIAFDQKAYNRAMMCSPVGFVGGFKCENVLCPNCYIRKALNYSKKLEKCDETLTNAVVIKLMTPFEDHAIGYSPVFSTAPRVALLKKFLKPEGRGAMAMSYGIAAKNKKPSLCICFHILCKPEEITTKLKAAQKFKTALSKFKDEQETSTKIIQVVDKRQLPAIMYGECPIKLLTCCEKGFKDLDLAYTVNQFFQLGKKRKMNVFFKT